MHMCKAIIFDLGKVVFDLSFDRTFQYWATASDRPFEDIKSKFDFDSTFNKFEKGEIASRQFRTDISQRLNLKLSDHEFDKGWCALYLDTYSGIDKVLAELKLDYKIVALTNTNIIHSKVWKVKYADTLQHFQKIFSSHELKERKPDLKAYQIVLDYLGIEPQQAVFLDDNLANIKGAFQLGIKTILVTSYKQMTEELEVNGLLKRSTRVIIKSVNNF